MSLATQLRETWPINPMAGPLTRAQRELAHAAADRLDLLEEGLTRQNDEICQTLGKALGYPWFKDDQKNFPGATEANGVCVGDHVAESLAAEAADRLANV